MHVLLFPCSSVYFFYILHRHHKSITFSIRLTILRNLICSLSCVAYFFLIGSHLLHLTQQIQIQYQSFDEKLHHHHYLNRYSLKFYPFVQNFFWHEHKFDSFFTARKIKFWVFPRSNWHNFLNFFMSKIFWSVCCLTNIGRSLSMMSVFELLFSNMRNHFLDFVFMVSYRVLF